MNYFSTDKAFTASTIQKATQGLSCKPGRKPLTRMMCLACLVVIAGCNSSGTVPVDPVTDDPVTDTTDTPVDNNTADNPDNTSDNNTVSTEPTGLAALPNPPLTAAPAADDEPIPESGNFHSVTAFLPVRDPGPRILKGEPVLISLADFEAGPLPATVSAPDDVDQTTNAAPYFENLTDQEVIAGQILNVRYIPRDPDGGLPGMFPEELPEGSEFIDNFDGTKSFVWQPLQGDAGIREFTVVALDPENSLYRTRRTIRIKIDLPADPSDIPNRRPRIEEFPLHTVRVNDPVVIELKGKDLNDTVPTLSIENLPTGATFTQHPQFEEIFVLRFVPVVAGLVTFDVISTDADDATLTNSETVSIEVLDADSFSPDGQRLRDLAQNRDFLIGYASRQEFYHTPDGEIYSDIAASEFNIVTAENSMKMDVINPLPGVFRFAAADNLVTFANQNDLAIHGHPLVWYNQIPDWVHDSDISDRETHMREYISRVLQRYSDNVEYWDVVNEPMNADGSLRNSVWFEAMGEEYIDLAFRQTRELAPDSVLILNEYDIEIDGAKSDGFFALVERLQLREIPVDAVGFQMHLFTTFDQFDQVQQKFDRTASLDLDFYITELDVSFPEGSTNRDLEAQAEVYRQIMSLCLQQPRCKGLQTWGFTDQYSWRERLTPLIFDSRYQAKPAYYALQQALTQ